MNPRIRVGGVFMNYTKIENHKVYFIVKKGDEWKEISDISGEDILCLLDNIIDDDDFSIVPYESDSIKNECHNIIYKNLYTHFNELLQDKESLLDQVRSKYNKIIEKYEN